ncbi:MAG: 50S ribosomal protein L4 [Rickettsiaceae bacterium H1]|nr:50S ribosomal protein L4 [Rickettsiaceae bacterium H1]
MIDLKELGKIDMDFELLSKEVFDVDANFVLLHDIIRWQLAKKRLGSRKTKGISDIKATTRKPYKQKGTGRARQGSLCSPQFRGGAVIFGPVVRNHSFSLNKKVRKLGIKMALSEKVKQNELLVIDNEQLTKINWSKYQDFKKNSILIISDQKTFKISSSCYVNIISCDGINVYSVMRHDYVLLTHDSVKYLNKRFV